MKQFSILILSLFCGTFACFAQNVFDSVFTNVIKIEDKNITKLGNKTLIDVSIPTEIKTPIVFFDTSVKNEISRDLLFRLYIQYDYIMFIVPDWNVSKRKTNVKAFTIYKLDRGRRNGTGKGSVDSLNIQENFPKLQFADMKLKDEEVDIYYQIGYGSVCCPRDNNWDNYESNQESLKKQIDKIGDGYKIVRGKEGEHIVYYTLAGTAQEKLNFLVGSSFETPPNIFTPFRQNITRATKVEYNR